MKRIIFYSVLALLFLLVDSCSEEQIRIYEITTSSSPEQGGSVTPEKGSYESGEDIRVIATPADGYEFKNWDGDLTGTINPAIIRINSDRSIIAIFEMLDADNDGVSDTLDQCSNTPPDSDVDANGCANTQKDTDNDGVLDGDDLCLDTPEGETVDAQGCSDSQKDSDGDGINDDLDLCAETPEGEEVNESGCSASQSDSDEDTIPDDIDQCPDTPMGETADEFGCSPSQKDSDADGITDDLDKCQNTPEGETVDAEGCSDTQVDSDGDTLTDDLDQCPDTPEGETIDDQGCSESQKDDDGDGVNNLLDQCPDTPDGEGVNSIGCSASQEDTDGDGITNNIDQCPGTPSGETADAEGCSDSQKDSDADGVSDDLDECADTPTGETVDSKGCSASQIDTDEDGVTDNEDQCPDTPNGESVNAEGCSTSQTDSDEDGVFDNADQCPDTPAGETVDAQGCSDSQKDSDGDGVTDDLDQCPDTPDGESVDENGCILVLRTYVPDDGFEQKLIDLGYDDVLDDYVLTASIENVIELGFRGEGIRDLTGLRDFSSLENLSFGGDHNIPLVDVRGMTSLISIGVGYNGPENFILENNINLKSFIIRIEGNAYNGPAPDFSQAPNLEVLLLEEAYSGQYLDLSNCAKLKSLSLSEGSYEMSSLSLNPLLEYIGFERSSRVPLEATDLTNNPNLRSFFIIISSLEERDVLDLSSCVSLESLHIESTLSPLYGLNLKNGNNQNIKGIVLAELENYIQCIEVDDPAYSQNNWNTSPFSIDPNTVFSTDCGY